MLPILNIPKSITNTAVFVLFFLFAWFAPVHGQNCGTIYYGSTDGDLLNGSCTLGLQTPSIGKECASCVVKNQPGFRDFFVNNGLGSCNNQQIINYWAHGGIEGGPHNFYEGDVTMSVCNCSCAKELANPNTDYGNGIIVPTIRPTLIPTTVTTPTVISIPTAITTPKSLPSPTAEIIKTELNVSSLNINIPVQDNTQENTPKITFPKINIKENLATIIQFFTSIFTRFFKEASF